MPVHAREDNRSLLLPADLPGEIEQVREELSAERDRHLRTLADFKNYRRRIERDGNKLAGQGKREIILPLLDIVDDVEKALQWATHEGHTPAQGVRMIYQKFLALLAAHEVHPFDSVGTPFNHNLHEAVAMVSHKEMRLGTVVDELRRGYLWKDEVLRPAQVRVAE